MVGRVRSLGLLGLNGCEVSVECSLSGGLPNFDIVGLADTAVKEARNRVHAAIRSCGLRNPPGHVTVNLAPADMRKIGTVYDLPILLSVLTAEELIDQPSADMAFLGELSLSGELRPIRGTLSMALAAEKLRIRELFVPLENASEASFAKGVTVYGVEHVGALLRHLAGTERLTPAEAAEPEPEWRSLPDFADVKGQENAKRALEIAAAGGHNVLLSGPPGAGKSMLAKRLPSILPDMTRAEALEATEIHSLLGLTSSRQPILTSRPFRSPHHTVSSVAMAGGTSNPRPGEVSLAHNGVLFLDELPEFLPQVLDTLRQPLEDGIVTVSRAAATVTYPSRFMLVCAMNPCKCGWYGTKRCTCQPEAVRRYRSRISGPMLDRIDLFIDVPALEFDELRRPGGSAESSSLIRSRVNAARKIQSERFSDGSVSCNARMSTRELAKYCLLDDASTALMRKAYDKLGLTGRSYDRILRVARTIADLDGSESIRANHVAEAIQYRIFQPV